MFNFFSGNKQPARLNFRQALARLVARNLDMEVGSNSSDDIASKIIEQTYSFDYSPNGAYDPLISQNGPGLISPIAYMLATKSWKIEHADGVSYLAHRLISKHGLDLVQNICQCFDYSIWEPLRSGFVQGRKTENGYAISTYGSVESAERIADEARRHVIWIGAAGLGYLLKLARQNSSYHLSSENAYILRWARKELASMPDQNPGYGSKMYDDRDRAVCIESIDMWI